MTLGVCVAMGRSHPAALTELPPAASQATALDDMLVRERVGKINAVIEFKIPDETLVERICGRLIHAASGRSYHEKFAVSLHARACASPRSDQHPLLSVPQSAPLL